jgi:hypothetical protein
VVVSVTPRQKVFAICVSIALLATIVELVRRRKLREEYSWLWVTAGVVILALALSYDFVRWLTHLVGAATPTTTVFLLGILFLVAVTVQYSIRLSDISRRAKDLAQELALMKMAMSPKGGSSSDGSLLAADAVER